ncbi:MAG: SUMF1/EgtB/PvdO family nonheme iron enzyme [Deltaproteobacteria bacterium]|nr:SUMF1/EgtB/PvdO family nonheme iron enzyme [Deltaproteobacteria bacterium]
MRWRAALAAMLLALAGCDGGSGPSDGGTDGGIEGCAFPFEPLATHELPSPMGGTWEMMDRHVFCTIDFEDVQAEVLLKAEPIEINYVGDPVYEATEAWVCQADKMQQLAEGSFYYETYHHGWEQMGLSFGGRKYVFDYADMCVGARPCNSTFEVYEVRDAADDSLLAADLPAVCFWVTEDGKRKPLVRQVRLPAEGGDVGFQMGSAQGDADEQPVHAVTLRPFRIDVREASWADLALFLDAWASENDCEGVPCFDAEAPGSHLHLHAGEWEVDEGCEDLPALGLSYQGAELYCRFRDWRSMPTEAQFEYAASAQGTEAYPWGEQAPDCSRAVFADCEPAAPVATCSLEPGVSLDGVCDLAGNAAEWVRDFYAADYYTSCEAECRYPRGPADPTGQRVLRGGSFESPPSELRAASRVPVEADALPAGAGVRCVGGAGDL